MNLHPTDKKIGINFSWSTALSRYPDKEKETNKFLGKEGSIMLRSVQERKIKLQNFEIT